MILWDLAAHYLHIKTKTIHWLVNYALCLVNALEEPRVDLPLLLWRRHAVIDHDLDSIFEHHFDQSFGHVGRVVHRWGAVDFDQPAIEVVIYHNIISEHLERYTFLFFCNDVLH